MGDYFDRGDIYPHRDIWILTLKRIHAEGLQQSERGKMKQKKEDVLRGTGNDRG